MGFDIGFMFVALKAAIKYTPITLIMSFASLVLGCIIGTFIALTRVFQVKILNRLSQVFVVIIKGIPIVLLILILYFAVVQSFDGLAEKFHWSLRAKDIPLIYIAIIALSLFASANISEAIRGALLAVDEGQYEAAYSAGLTTGQTLRRIVLPQALPVAVPMLCSSLIGLIKGSSLVFMISVTDLMNAALITATSNYKFLEAYVAAAIVYWVICIVIEKLSFILEKRLRIYSKGEVL
ncbi:amino acid ABC transporter permease [Clostridium sp. WILCCON 0269]|uniref:Amino acid ABC transporter permease n=1 Tax=Candidatus Clostridium eludens TaxID=3381663 RepID=A0ABW8SHT8_9CLOT